MRFRHSLVLLALFAVLAHAQPQVFLLASAGEALYRPANDLMESTILPQAGLGIALSHAMVTPYSETTVGYYNQRLLAEQFFGLQIGKTLWLAKPSFTLGVGFQTVVKRKYEFDSDVFERKRLWLTPYGLGLRLDVLEMAYAEWEARVNGYPMWKFEIGWRVS